MFMIIRVNVDYILINYGIIIYVVKEVINCICYILIDIFFIIVIVCVGYFVDKC